MARSAVPPSLITESASTVAPKGDTSTVMVPIQSGLTVYVPSIVTVTMLRFALKVAVLTVLPFPSMVCLPTSTNGPARGHPEQSPRVPYGNSMCRAFAPAATGGTKRVALHEKQGKRRKAYIRNRVIHIRAVPHIRIIRAYPAQSVQRRVEYLHTSTKHKRMRRKIAV